ncbi:hypothetical protein ACFFH4_00845 [Halalkalibacter alkalisediminis]|uniref:Transposase n=1 Tax=Halalkalibacter alkalisediminis TaxID=935616 RepID=A0ABV6NAU8_9BACI
MFSFSSASTAFVNIWRVHHNKGTLNRKKEFDMKNFLSQLYANLCNYQEKRVKHMIEHGFYY